MHITRRYMKLLIGVITVVLVLAVGLPYSGLSWTALAQYGSAGTTGTTVVSTLTGNNGVTYQLLSNGNVIVTSGGQSTTVNVGLLIGRTCAIGSASVVVAPGITAYATGLDINTGACVWQLNVGFLDDTVEIWVFPGGRIELRKRA